MRAKDIKSWVDKNKDHYIDLMNLRNWHINIYVINKKNPQAKLNNEERINESDFCASGDCRTWFEYRNARVRLFADQITDEKYLHRVFVHELAHVATSSFQLYCRYFEKEILNRKNEKDLSNKLERDVCELLAIQFENAVCGLSENTSEIRTIIGDIEEKIDLYCLPFQYTGRQIILESDSPNFRALQEEVRNKKISSPERKLKKQLPQKNNKIILLEDLHPKKVDYSFTEDSLIERRMEIIKNDAIPFLEVLVTPECSLPNVLKKDEKILLNVSYAAVRNFHVTDDILHLDASFNRVVHHIKIPLTCILNITDSQAN